MSHYVMSMRDDVFLSKHIIVLEGHLKMVASRNCMNTRKTECPNVAQVDLTSECRPCGNSNVDVNYVKGNCIKCKKTIHVDSDYCPTALSIEDKSQVICLRCVELNIPIENTVRENWKGLGYTPTKENSTCCKVERNLEKGKKDVDKQINPTEKDQILLGEKFRNCQYGHNRKSHK